MMRSNYFIKETMSFVFFMLILVSCRKETSLVSSSPKYIANLDSTYVTEFKYSEIFKSVTAITLENKEVMLVGISKMLVYMDKLYILDSESQGVYAFEKDGSFIRKFGNLGAGPDEYANCKDFAINTDIGEIYIYDMAKNRIYKYDISTGTFKGSIHLHKNIDIDYLTYSNGHLYAAQTSNRNKDSSDIYYLLYKIDIESGKELARFLDATSYNKGWNDELLHGNIFYKIRGSEDLFVLGLMDTIMCIGDDNVFPFLAINGRKLVQKSDIFEEEKIPSIDPRIRSKRLISLLSRLNTTDKMYHFSDIYEHNDMLYFNCFGRIRYYLKYDMKNRLTYMYSRKTDDVLFQKTPEHFQLPKFLNADRGGVYYYIPTANLSELKYLFEENFVSSKTVNNGENILRLDDDSNPIILHYEYKE